MPSTSVYLPEDLLRALDRLAAELQLPRNRIIVEALRDAIRRKSRHWPEGYFSGEHLGPGDLEEIRSGAEEFERGIHKGRRSRSRAPF